MGDLMKVFALLASLALSAPVAFAQQSVDAYSDEERQIYELEVGAMPYDEAQALQQEMQLNRDHRRNRSDRDRGAEIIGGIIGGIIDNAINDRDGRPGHGGPGWGGPGHGFDREVVCYARDARGNLYRAIGPNPRRVQDRALDKCERNARFCRPQGCQRI